MAAANPASAATMMFNAGGSNNANGGKNFTVGTGNDAVSVHVSAWTVGSSAITNSWSFWPQFSVTTTANFAANAGHNAATLGQWADGLGVQTSSGDEHTVDNNGSKDFLLLQFSTAVTLKNAMFTTGWSNMNDTDATISYANVAYTGGKHTFNNTGSAFWNAAGAQLTANQYSSASPGASGNSTRNVNKPTLVTSNVWLIAAKVGDIDTYKDGFKLKGVTYDLPGLPPPPGTGAVPEPATWAMLILGMGMIGGAMRRQNRARLALA